jgi:Bacterial extracellular solute-binding protein
VNAKRLLAILAAAAMIAGAWFVRTKVIDKKTTVATGGDTTQPTNATATERRIVCVAELESVCELSGSVYSVEPASTTLDMLATEPNPDIVWITTSPLPEMADLARVRASLPPLSVDQRRVLGSTAVVLAAPTDRVRLLRAACPELSWKCIGEKTNRPWTEIGGDAALKDVTFRHRDPLTSASGLSVFGAALAGRTGRTDIATADLASPDIRSWTNLLENANKQPTSDPLSSIMNGSRFDMVGALATEVTSVGRVATLEPTPVARVGATIMVTSGKLPVDLLPKLSEALGKNGWNPTVAPSGLPDAVGMEAVQQLWKQVISS